MERPKQVSVFDGVRVLCSIVVMFHHIGSLDPSLWDPAFIESKHNWFQIQEERLRFEKEGPLNNQTSRLLMGGKEADNASPVVQALYYVVGVGPGHVAVEVFLNMAGFVAAHAVYAAAKNRCERSPGEAQASFEQRIASSLFSRYQKSLLKRFWRLALPLIPVQLAHVTLWSQRLAYGPYLWFPSNYTVQEGFSHGIPSIWSPVLSGSLWILETLFFAPFVALCVQLPVQSLTARSRVTWYLLCLAYFVRDLTGNRSYNVSVVIGVAMADMYNHMFVENLSKPRALLQTAVALLFVSVTWFPGPFYAHTISMVVSATGITYLALYSPLWLNKLLSNRVMAFLSQFAYELYIWHLIVLNLFAVNVYPVASKAVLYIAGFGSCLATAVVAFYLFELPAMKFSDWFVEWMLGKPSTTNCICWRTSCIRTVQADASGDKVTEAPRSLPLTVDV